MDRNFASTRAVLATAFFLMPIGIISRRVAEESCAECGPGAV